MLEIKKTGNLEVRQQPCPTRKICEDWAQIQSDLNKGQLTYFEATDLAFEELIFGRDRVEDVLRPSLMVPASF